MTDRVQTSRSSTTGGRPPAGEKPGTLYVNWADNQLGAVSPGGAPQDLIAVRFFSPNAGYVQGDHVVEAGVMYSANGNLAPGVFNSGQWTVVGAVSAGYLPLSGGVLTGPLTLAGNPVNPNDAATKNYVDTEIAAGGGGGGGGGSGINPNLLINGGMRIAQATGGNAVRIANNISYIVDHWFAGNNAGYPGLEIGQNLIGAGNPPLPPGFSHFMGAVVIGGPYSVGGNDTFALCQWVEADAITNLMWGTPNAKTVTLSFWVWMGYPGPYSVSIHNGARNRSYVVNYSATVAVWTLVSITIPGDTGGVWTSSGNGAGMFVNFAYGTGGGVQGVGNLWSNGKLYATSLATVLPETPGSLLITGVKLEVGTVFSGYLHQSLTEQLANCQRYYAKTYSQSEVPGTASLNVSPLSAYAGPTADATSALTATWDYPVTMCAVPTITLFSPNTGAVGKAFASKAVADVNAGEASVSDNSATLAISTASIAAREIVKWHACASAELTPTL